MSDQSGEFVDPIDGVLRYVNAITDKSDLTDREQALIAERDEAREFQARAEALLESAETELESVETELKELRGQMERMRKALERVDERCAAFEDFAHIWLRS